MSRVTKYQAHSRTSIAAAKAIEIDADTIRGRLYRYIAWCRNYGATDEEMQLDLELNPNTQRPRRVELGERGLITSYHQVVRRTRSGRNAVVWFVTGMAPKP